MALALKLVALLGSVTKHPDRKQSGGIRVRLVVTAQEDKACHDGESKTARE